MCFGYGFVYGQQGVVENLKLVVVICEVIGYDNDLMFECYMGWIFEYVKCILLKFEKYQLCWLEELVIVDDFDGYVELNWLMCILIFGGEYEFLLYGFKQLFDCKVVLVVQYDMNCVGGIMMVYKINVLCEVYSVLVILYVGQMYNYYLMMSMFVLLMSEYFLMFDVEVGNELFYYIFDGELVVENGFL